MINYFKTTGTKTMTRIPLSDETPALDDDLIDPDLDDEVLDSDIEWEDDFPPMDEDDPGFDIDQDDPDWVPEEEADYD